MQTFELSPHGVPDGNAVFVTPLTGSHVFTVQGFPSSMGDAGTSTHCPVELHTSDVEHGSGVVPQLVPGGSEVCGSGQFPFPSQTAGLRQGFEVSPHGVPDAAGASSTPFTGSQVTTTQFVLGGGPLWEMQLPNPSHVNVPEHTSDE